MNLLILKTGLTESQFNILDALFHIGSLSQGELGKKLLKSGGNITMVVDNLEKRKLVKRERNKNDRRFFTIHLTKSGSNLIQKLFPQVLSALVDEINVLTENEQIEFQRMCKLLGLHKTDRLIGNLIIGKLFPITNQLVLDLFKYLRKHFTCLSEIRFINNMRYLGTFNVYFNNIRFTCFCSIN